MELEEEILSNEILEINHKVENTAAPQNLKWEKPGALKIFNLLFDSELLSYISQQTNDYAKFKEPKTEFETDPIEIQKYLFIYIYASVLQFPDMDMFWRQSLYYSTSVPRIMTRRRFFEISTNFHVSDDFQTPHCSTNDRLKKFQSILDRLNQQWQKFYTFSKFLTVDESLAAFKGRILFKQFIPSKRKRSGIKFFTKSNAVDGYVYEMIPYSGRDFIYDKQAGQGPSVLTRLLKAHKRDKSTSLENSHVSFDNFYSSMPIIKYCQDNNIDFTCTWNNHRKTLPKMLREMNLKLHEKRCFKIKDTNTRFLVFRDKKKRQTYLSSNYFDCRMVNYSNANNKKKTKPEMVYGYNKTRSGVDQIDCATSIYSTQRKVYKWWKACFFYLYDITIYNASVLYFKIHKKKVDSKMNFFRTALYEEFFGAILFPNTLIRGSIMVQKHFPYKSHSQKECKKCLRSRRGDSDINNIKTWYKCKFCKVHLCIDCFDIYHSSKF